MSSARERSPVFTTMAVLFGVLAVSNFTKALQHLRNPEHLGIVVFGVRYESLAANLLLGPLMGAVLAAYAYGLWTRRPWLIPLSFAYAFYTAFNTTLFWYFQIGTERPSLAFMLVYLAIGLGGSIGTALYVAYHHLALTAPAARSW